jgi:kynurenine formamidase
MSHHSTRRDFLAHAGLVAAALAVPVLAACTDDVEDEDAAESTRGGEQRVYPAFRHVHDLTHVLSPAFPVLPVYQPLKMEPVYTVETVGVAVNQLTMHEHIGTHVDAPSHFTDSGRTTDELHARELVAPLVVVRITERAERDPAAQLEVDDVLAWESRNGRLPAGCFVAMDSGWSMRALRPGEFLNEDSGGTWRFPGIGARAAEFLVAEREIVGAGVDTFSLDPGPTPLDDLASHAVLLGSDKYGIECLADLAGVPEVGATLVVGAPKHSGGTGGPARVFALA